MNKVFYFNKVKKRQKTFKILSIRKLISPFNFQANKTVKENMKNLSVFQIQFMVRIKDFRWKGNFNPDFWSILSGRYSLLLNNQFIEPAIFHTSYALLVWWTRCELYPHLKTVLNYTSLYQWTNQTTAQNTLLKITLKSNINTARDFTPIPWNITKFKNTSLTLGSVPHLYYLFP